MKRGFMDLVVNSIIPASPGHTALWYAREALAHDSTLSDSKTPLQSLANTLSKQVQTGRERRIRRERIRGVYCFFLAGSRSPEKTEDLQDIAIQISLRPEELEILDNFVAVDKFKNRSDAIVWLAREGIKAKRGDIDRVAQIRKQIEELKRSAPAV